VGASDRGRVKTLRIRLEGVDIMGEVCNYVTCSRGHKVYVIWSPLREQFGFTCDICNEHSARAISAQGLVEIKLAEPVGDRGG
jgi:hypothetical protein